jgi:hypothetical protein
MRGCLLPVIYTYCPRGDSRAHVVGYPVPVSPFRGEWPDRKVIATKLEPDYEGTHSKVTKIGCNVVRCQRSNVINLRLVYVNRTDAIHYFS